jgi:hypothetical protein
LLAIFREIERERRRQNDDIILPRRDIDAIGGGEADPLL